MLAGRTLSDLCRSVLTLTMMTVVGVLLGFRCGLMLGEGALAPGQTVAGQVALTLLWATALTVVCVPLAVRAYRRAAV